MGEPPRYKSEIFIPIKQDNKSFEDRQRGIWENTTKKGNITVQQTSNKSSNTSTTSNKNDFPSSDFGKGFDRDFSSDFDKEFSSMRSELGSSMGFNTDPFGDGDSKSMIGRMQDQMDLRRAEWETEIERMRKDFFSLKPNDAGVSDIKTSDWSSGGDNKFHMSFDVKQFKPEEINVRTQDQKLIVHAKHEETLNGRSSTREFSRQVDIPKNVDVEKLISTLSNDGILQVEMEVPAPSYNSIRNESVSSATSVSSTNSLASPGSTSTASRGSAPGGTSSSLFDSSFPATSMSGGFNQGPVITEQDGRRTLKMEIDIGKDFNPSDLNIKTVNNKLQIHAKHEEASAGRTSSREFNRELDLPDDVDADSLTASMTDNGKLIIEAPISSYTKGAYQGKPGARKQPTVTVTLKK